MSRRERVKAAIPVTFEAAWVLASLIHPHHIMTLYIVPLYSRVSLACRLHARSNVLGIRKFVIYFESSHLVDRDWEMQEGLAVEPHMNFARVLN